MNLKTTIAGVSLLFGLLFIISCGNDQSSNAETNQKTDNPQDLANSQSEVHGTQIKEGDIQITHPLDQKMVADGQAIYGLKCQSCHRLTADKLVGPGWKDVTKRRTPVWIMNMITNVDMMLESDAEAQKLLEQCMVRMPNQNITKDDARKVLEFMRSNDGEK